MIKEDKRTVCEQIEDICGKICDNYCKWPEKYGSTDEDYERLIEEKCNSCPLEDLY